MAALTYESSLFTKNFSTFIFIDFLPFLTTLFSPKGRLLLKTLHVAMKQRSMRAVMIMGNIVFNINSNNPLMTTKRCLKLINAVQGFVFTSKVMFLN